MALHPDKCRQEQAKEAFQVGQGAMCGKGWGCSHVRQGWLQPCVARAGVAAMCGKGWGQADALAARRHGWPRVQSKLGVHAQCCLLAMPVAWVGPREAGQHGETRGAACWEGRPVRVLSQHMPTSICARSCSPVGLSLPLPPTPLQRLVRAYQNLAKYAQ